MSDIVCAVISGLSVIVVAIIGYCTKKNNDKIIRESEAEHERMAENSKARKRESLLSLQMMDATLQLSIVCANALTNQHNNGNVEIARIASQKVADEYNQFMKEMTANAVSK